MRNPEEATAYDVRCHVCKTTNGTRGDAVHVAWLGPDHAPGDSIGLAHRRKPGACGHYCEHEIVAELPTLDHPETKTHARGGV